MATNPRGVVYGFDINQESLKIAAQEFDEDARLFGGKFVWIVADLRNGIPLADKSVDYVILAALIENLGKKSGASMLLKDASRVIKPGGLAFVSWTMVSPHYEERYRNDFCFTGEENTIVIWRPETTQQDKNDFYLSLYEGRMEEARRLFVKFGDRLVHHLSGLDELMRIFSQENFTLKEWEIVSGITARNKRPINIGRAVLQKNW